MMNTSLRTRKLIFILVMLALIGLFAMASPRPVGAADPPTAIVDTGSLNVRAGPGVGYGIVAEVKQGDKLTLLGRNSAGSWVRVRTAANKEGWVNATLIFPSVAVQTLPVVQADTLNTTAVVNTGSLNVRAGPGTTYQVVTTAGRGSVLGLLGRNANATWVKVNPPNGKQGWVNAALLTYSINLNTLPIVDSPPVGSPTGSTAVVTADSLNVRARADVNSQVLTKLAKNEAVTMLGRTTNSGWIQVRTSGNVVGWVAGFLIQPGRPFSELPVLDGSSGAPIPVGDGTVQGWASVFVRSLNVRSGPGTSFNITGGLKYKDRVDMLGRSSDNGWVKIRFANGSTGWVSSSFVYTSVYVHTLPVVN